MRRLHLDPTPQLEALTRAAGDLYTRTVVSFWRTVRKHGLWLKPSTMMRWHTSDRLHAHSADAVIQSFYAALKSWRKTDPNAKPPYRRCWYYRVQWKASAIHVKDGYLILSNGRSNAPFIVPWRWGVPPRVELGWTGTEYELRCAYAETLPAALVRAQPGGLGGSTDAMPGTKTAGADLGEIHLVVVHDGQWTLILNGRALRAKVKPRRGPDTPSSPRSGVGVRTAHTGFAGNLGDAGTQGLWCPPRACGGSPTGAPAELAMSEKESPLFRAGENVK